MIKKTKTSKKTSFFIMDPGTKSIYSLFMQAYLCPLCKGLSGRASVLKSAALLPASYHLHTLQLLNEKMHTLYILLLDTCQ